jgi:hypothetical protein
MDLFLRRLKAGMNKKHFSDLTYYEKRDFLLGVVKEIVYDPSSKELKMNYLATTIV